MITADLVTLLAFGLFTLLGLALLTVRQMFRQRPRHRVVEQLRHTVQTSADTTRQEVLEGLHRAQADARRRRRRASMGMLGYALNRLDTIAGRKGPRILIAVGVGTFVLALLLALLGVLPDALWVNLLAVLGGPIFAMVLIYRKMVDRFRTRFLAQLPDAIDLIVRASHAGVPVSQSIRTVGERFASPLGPEFRRMGDSLLLGNDMEDVLDDATLRIEMQDFTFLAVCLLLQRETGGSLTETLENLSSIIRARRDLALKSRALTAEGRASSLVLSLLPFGISGALILVNPEYISVMFEHPTGQRMLWIAGGMLAFGIFLIRKISRLDV